MRIAIDGRTIVGDKTGVGVYAERIVRSLLSIDRRNHYFLFLVEPIDDLQAPNLTTLLIKGYNRAGLNRVWENVLMPRFAARNNIDLYFSPAYALPLLPPPRLRFVAVIHDLIGLLYPETFTPKMRLWQKIFVANAAKVADRIITGSEATKTDFLRLYPSAASKTSVIYHSIDDDYRPADDMKELDRVRSAYSLPEKIVLYVGTVEPRKNVAHLARGFALLPESLRNQYTLVIAGKPGWFVESIKTEITRLELGDKVRFIGYVDRHDLPSLYQLATLFVYPSIYEGFGFPPLEAMSCGVPVLCSNTSSFPEVVGDAAIMVDPHDVGQMTKELEKVLSDSPLREEMRKKGFAQARRFSARKTAEETLKVLEEAAGVR
jgi:glycosyltransferase involved in cell wall biosynthesis